MEIPRLIEFMTLPGLYEKGTASMWEDDHISRHLLDIHLNQETDAASRKKSSIQKTVEWIELHLNGSEKKCILDLGCGPGLYCELLAEHGHQVTGVDFSKRSIAHAKQAAAEKNLKIDYIHQNYLDLSFENRFDLIMMIYCDFDVLIPEDRSFLLQIVSRALRPGGMFIFDTLNPKAPEKMNIPGKSWETAETGFWMNKPYLALSETFHYEEQNVILQQHIIFSESEHPAVYRFWTHYYRQEDLTCILHEQGLPWVMSFENILQDDGTDMYEMVTFYIARKNDLWHR
jgi:2-polyprenyl-3-methyl-5-hydroxy-6-metoxy-1,4-benzoquinol methylase